MDINDNGLILANGCYMPPSDLSQCTTKLSVLLYPIAHGGSSLNCFALNPAGSPAGFLFAVGRVAPPA